jgi:uncharacterized protein DUF664
MTGSDPKADLRRYLQESREALLWKLDGLSEYDIRRPLVPTGTNLLGLIKHQAGAEMAYFGDTFGRPCTSWSASPPIPAATPGRRTSSGNSSTGQQGEPERTPTCRQLIRPGGRPTGTR